MPVELNSIWFYNFKQGVWTLKSSYQNQEKQTAGVGFVKLEGRLRLQKRNAQWCSLRIWYRQSPSSLSICCWRQGTHGGGRWATAAGFVQELGQADRGELSAAAGTGASPFLAVCFYRRSQFAGLGAHLFFIQFAPGNVAPFLGTRNFILSCEWVSSNLGKWVSRLCVCVFFHFSPPFFLLIQWKFS